MRFLYPLIFFCICTVIAYGQMTDDAISTPENTVVTLNVLDNDAVLLPDPGSLDLNPLLFGPQTSFTTTGGTFSIVSNAGDVSFTPDLNFSGIASVEYSIVYSVLFTGTATFSVTVVAAADDPPVAVNDVFLDTFEDVPATHNILANDTDPDNDINPATVLISSEVGGTFVADNTGIVTFTPTQNFNGIASASYTVSDVEGHISNTATIIVNVIPVADPPIAANDNVGLTTNENTPLTIPVSDNDSDPDGTLDLTSIIVTISEHGNWDVNGIGGIIYTPTAGYSGPANAKYTIKDNEGNVSNVADIAVTVNAVNDPPVATADTESMAEDGAPITIGILNNDSDPDGVATIDPLSVELRSPTNGTFVWNAGARLLTFTPTPNFFGVASVQYRVSDTGGLASAWTDVTITVTTVNDAPVATAIPTQVTNENVTITFSGVSNATDIDGQIDGTFVELSGPFLGGTFVAIASGVIEFRPTPGFSGNASAQYRVRDNLGTLSNLAGVTVTVNAVNDPPVAVNDATPWEEDKGPLDIPILNNDTDPDGNGTLDKTSVLLSAMVGGTFSVSSLGILTYAPTPNFNGSASVKYTVKDNGGLTSNEATVTITVTPINDIPLAAAITESTDEDAPITFNVASQATDIDNAINPASIVILSFFNGTFQPNTNGTITFTPNLGFAGTATASYTIKDVLGGTSAAASITINVSSVNTPPVAVDDTKTINEDAGPQEIFILANDSDPDGGSLNNGSVVLSSPVNGDFNVSTTGILTYTAPANFNGIASVKYTVKDNGGLISNVATVTITVTPFNDLPTFAAIADQRVLRNSGNKTVTVTGISSGAANEADVLTVSVSSNNPQLILPTVAYTSPSAIATITFKPVADQAGSATITVTVNDGGTDPFSRTFVIEVVDVHFTSTPVTLAIPGELYEYFIEITDVTETLTILATQKPAWATLTANGKNKAKLSGTPTDGSPLNSQVTLQLKDNATILEQQVFNIVVNRPPVVSPIAMEAKPEDSPVTVSAANFQAQYNDPDNQPLMEIQIDTLPKRGVLQLGSVIISAGTKIPVASLNNLVYTPNKDYNGTDVAYWRASDGYSYSKLNSTINFVITPVNDAPLVDNIEITALQYELGSEIPVRISNSITVTDVDNTDLTGAEIGITFNEYLVDKMQLVYKDTLGIVGNFNVAAGILVLTGKASVTDYQSAIRSIRFNYLDVEEIKLGEQVNVYYIVSDGSADRSASKSREIEFIYTFKDLFIPTAFTPGGNDRNETWVITSPNTDDGSVPFNDANIRVFNKKGVMVFETTGFENPWDGTFAGEPLPSDTYFYTIDLKYNKVKYKGVVTILR